jgi:general secretion pathway protein D
MLMAGVIGAADPAERPATGGGVNFSFEDVDIRSFVKLVGEATGKRFVIGEGVSGKVTVVSPRVSPAEVYPLFLSIIESAGYSVHESGGLLHVVPLKGYSAGLASVLGAGDAVPLQGVYTKIFKLSHVSAAEISKALQPGKESAGGTVRALEETNHLVVTDSASGIRRVERLLAEIDQSGMARVTDVIGLQFASADEMAQQLNLALAENQTRAQRLVERLPAGRNRVSTGDDARTAMVVAVPHSNRLIVVGTQTQVDSLRELIARMDVDVPSGHGRLNAIFLRHLSAEEAAENIGALLKQRQQAGEAQSMSRNIAIQASPSSNALLVDAGPGDFDVVKRLIEQLDQSPEQVHIGVVIMEVSHGDGFQFGMDFAAVDRPQAVGDTVVQGSFGLGDASGLLSSVQNGIFPRGMSIGVAHGSSQGADGTIQTGFPGLLNIDAFRSNSRFKILSETSLQSQNNKEATVSVVNEIPILKSEISGGSGTARDVIQNIERMDVGIKLRITPHFIPGGRIRMALNPSIEAVIDSGSTTTQFTPTIAKREVQTTVTVEDGRTIVIAGLTRQDERESERRVPYLGAIPILGWLFRRNERVSERTDVLIFVTPTVVSDVGAASSHQKRWEGKTGLNLNGQD